MVLPQSTCTGHPGPTLYSSSLFQYLSFTNAHSPSCPLQSPSWRHSCPCPKGLPPDPPWSERQACVLYWKGASTSTVLISLCHLGPTAAPLGPEAPQDQVGPRSPMRNGCHALPSILLISFILKVLLKTRQHRTPHLDLECSPGACPCVQTWLREILHPPVPPTANYKLQLRLSSS